MNDADLALVLALDGSASVTFEEFNLIAGGLAAAFRDAQVIHGLTAGPAGAALVSLLLWSGAGQQAVMIGWTRIASATDAAGFADAVDNMPRGVRAGSTAIGEALLAAGRLLDAAPAKPARRIVDVAGDGRSNEGVLPGPIRDAMAAAGITINGLCVLHEEPDLLDSYQREVIGGPGAFALVCPDYAAFAAAMRLKLLRELDIA
jgi:Ca-activated chloride channel family protein